VNGDDGGERVVGRLAERREIEREGENGVRVKPKERESDGRERQWRVDLHGRRGGGGLRVLSWHMTKTIFM
jgi:hypothetical protein